MFAQVLEQAGRDLGGRSQGVYIFSPAGTLLAFANTADGGHVKRLMEKALASYEPENAPPAVLEAKPNPSAANPPPGTRIALVTSKVMGGYDDVDGHRTDIHAKSLGTDHLWIRADEAAALAGGTFPNSLAKRIARYHLVDNTRGEPPFWSESEIEQLEVTLDNGTIKGRAVLSTADGSRQFQPEIFGRVETEGGKLTRFDIVARGAFQGEGQFTRGAPPGKFPFAVAARLVDPDRAADRVVPGAARGGFSGYLK